MPKKIKKTRPQIILDLQDVVTKNQFKGNFKRVLDFTVRFKKHILSEFSLIKQSISELSRKLENKNTTSISELRNEIKKVVDKSQKEQADGLNFLRDKAIAIKDFKNGKDADEKKIIKRVLRAIKLPEQKDAILDTPDTIANKLETLSGEGRLKIEAVLNLEKRLKELEERPIGRGGVMGGGVGKLALEAHFVDYETPLGDIDDSNVTFTLIKKPNPESSLRLYYSGIRMEQGADNDYTLSGAIITMNFAPETNRKLRADYRY